MAFPPSHGRIVRTLYRGLLRAARTLETSGDASAVVSRFTTPMGTGVQPGSMRAVVAHNFRCARKYRCAEDVQDLINIGFQGLQQANKLVKDLRDERNGSPAPSAATLRPPKVLFSVGSVIRHARYGYKAVVIGWSESCEASAEWVARNQVDALPHGTRQPFYKVLVDVRDRPEAQVSYVAQDNIALLSSPPGASVDGAAPAPAPAARLVLNPLVSQYFSEYKPVEGFYLPNTQLAQAYPFDGPSLLLAAAGAGRGDGTSGGAATSSGVRRGSIGGRG